jgi:hypothetical protein
MWGLRKFTNLIVDLCVPMNYNAFDTLSNELPIIIFDSIKLPSYDTFPIPSIKRVKINGQQSCDLHVSF